jgi:hypothetical protein
MSDSRALEIAKKFGLEILPTPDASFGQRRSEPKEL